MKHLSLLACLFIFSSCSVANPPLTESADPNVDQANPLETVNITLLSVGDVVPTPVGSAVLSDSGNGTKVTIAMPGDTDTHPSHLHQGNCELSDSKVSYELNAVINGSSETIIGIPRANLVSGKIHSIIIHKSNSDQNTIIACGEVSL